MEASQIVWLVLVVLCLVTEGATSTLVSIWFAVGALVALLVSVFWPDGVAVQIAVFLLVSILFLLALRPLAKKLIPNKRVPTNADANIGKIGQVVSEIRPEQFGRVKLEGLEWTAKADQVLPAGSWCKVEAIDGVKLIVSKFEREEL